MSIPVLRTIPRLARSGSYRVGRVYVLTTDELAGVLRETGPLEVVSHEGLRTHIVRGTTRPAGRRLPGRRRLVPCGDVERTELALPNGTAWLDHELGTDRVMVRTWAPRDGSDLDQTLWWQGHPVAARLPEAA